MTKAEKAAGWLVGVFLNDSVMDIDAFELQEALEDIGLVRPVPYDPEKHGPRPGSEGADPGDTIYEPTAEGKEALRAHREHEREKGRRPHAPTT
jgi:hypothetical protein